MCSIRKLGVILLLSLCTLESGCSFLCQPPYSCMSISECGSLHRGFDDESVDPVLYPCNSQNGNICCPPKPSEDNSKPKPKPKPKPTPRPKPSQQSSRRPPVVSTSTNAPSPSKSIQENMDLSWHRNFKLIPSDCGPSVADRIINGKEAAVGDFPWMVLVGYTGQGFQSDGCGGTLINNRYVLTAAHCLKSTSGVLTHVTVGEFNMSTPRDCRKDLVTSCSEAVKIRVSKIIGHQSYNQQNFKNDIALLRLDKEVEFGEFVRPVCLPFVTNYKDAKELKSYQATGWGISEQFGDSGTRLDTLQKVTLSAMQCNFCGRTPSVFCPISDTQFCAGSSRNQGVCFGDSGGPMTNDPLANDGIFNVVQFGVVSFKPSSLCAQENVPSVFTKVSSYLQWILDTIEP